MSASLPRAGASSDAVVSPPRGRRRGLAFTALYISLFFAVASNTMVLTGLPQIIGDLDGTQLQYTWIITTSLLVLAISTPVWGRLSERVSKTSLLMLSLALYAAGSVGAGAAGEPWTIVACRVLIGAGAGGIVTLVQLIVTALTTAEERPAYFGALGSVTSVAAILAPALGGIIVDVGGWRWVFFSTAPLAVVALLMVWRFTPALGRGRSARVGFDVAGTVAIAATVTAAMISLSLLHSALGFALVVGLLALALLGAAILLERRAASPLIPGELMRDRRIVLVLIASGVAGIGAFGTSVYLAMYFQNVVGLTAGESGLLLIPLSAATLIASLGTGFLVTRTARDKAALISGMVCITVGYGMLSLIGHDTPVAYVVVAGSIVSLGVGAVGQQLVATGQRFLTQDQTAVGSALILFLRSLATVLCLSAFGALLVFVTSLLPASEAALTGVRLVFACCFAGGLLGFAVVLALPVERRATNAGNLAITRRDEVETPV